MIFGLRQSEVFLSSTSDVAHAVRMALVDGQATYFYNTDESEDGLSFDVDIHCALRFFPSKMTIRLEPGDSQTRVIVEIGSGWLHWFDPYTSSSGYIRDILEAIGRRVESIAISELKARVATLEKQLRQAGIRPTAMSPKQAC